VNLGWWLAGLFAWVSGGPAWGFHALGLVAAAVFVSGAVRSLSAQGCSGTARAWATALVLAGSGLGWMIAGRGDLLPDLHMGLFPSAQRLLGNAHALLASGLLVWALTLHGEWRAGTMPRWVWLLVAATLGLVRPFDLVLLVGSVVIRSTSRGRRAEMLQLTWLAPVVVYDALAFGFHPAFSTWSSSQNVVAVPGAGPLFLALGPAASLAVAALRPRTGSGGEVQGAFLAAAGTGLLLLLSPLSFGFQFASGLGALLLIPAAPALGRALPFASLALAPTSLLLLQQLALPPAHWFPPRDYAAAVAHLRAECRPQDLALAPPNLSLMTAAGSPCRVAFGHRVLTPDYETRLAEVQTFYAETTTPAWRREYLRGLGVRFVVLPQGREQWLAGPNWRRVLSLPSLEIFAGRS